MRYVIFREVFCTESKYGLHFSPEQQVVDISLIKFSYKKQCMISKHFSMQNPTVDLIIRVALNSSSDDQNIDTFKK